MDRSKRPLKFMKTLKAGDIRRDFDEVRHIDKSKDGFDCIGRIQDTARPRTGEPHVAMPRPWESVSLVGHAILQSDLMVAEFRRP